MTTITREHLELAAKAAGYVVSFRGKTDSAWLSGAGVWWQPHTDPADAWDLAADCKMQVDFAGEKVEYLAYGLPYIKRFDSGANRTAAEAVTLAAAEIGRAMG